MLNQGTYGIYVFEQFHGIDILRDAFGHLLGGIVAPLTGLGNMIHSMTALVLLCSAVCLCLYLYSRRWNFGSSADNH